MHTDADGTTTRDESKSQPDTNNAAQCTPSSTSNEGSDSMSLPPENISHQICRASVSGTQSQTHYRRPRSPTSMHDGGHNENDIPWRTNTAADGSPAFNDYAPQDESYSTLQYPLEDGLIADTILGFDISEFQNFQSENQENSWQ
ncbi:hypothetical protein VM1G_11539 [Cytospora mali]|uniref:Uncharacterized protein n=1 Tax=Cytospora mali TaxID=578113 RepID=A0A194VW96_CYTMA|nr:hypothetical protein VM1G_11539 [Valsa mali]